VGQQLGQYAEDVRDLVADNLGMLIPEARLTRYINQARKQVAKYARCITVLVPGQCPAGASALPGELVPGGGTPGAAADSLFQTIVGQEMYAYGYANQYVQEWNSGVAGVLDVIQVAISWGGAMRPAMQWMPWDDYQAYLRANQYLTQAWPAVWSTLGDGSMAAVYLFPTPSVASEMEWLVVCNPKDIYTNDDYDVLPEPFDSAVKYYAAHLAYLRSQRPGQASLMLNTFYDHVGVDRASADGGKVSNYYYSYP
jgi:hypothetical protein